MDVGEVCPYCKGTGMAPGDGPTQCGFCHNGRLTEAQRREINDAWGRVFAFTKRFLKGT